MNTTTADLVYQVEVLKAELAMMHSYMHGMSLQIDKHGHFYIDGTGAIGIETGLYYTAALNGVTFEEDYDKDILWAVPADHPYQLDQEEI